MINYITGSITVSTIAVRVTNIMISANDNHNSSNSNNKTIARIITITTTTIALVYRGSYSTTANSSGKAVTHCRHQQSLLATLSLANMSSYTTAICMVMHAESIAWKRALAGYSF
jgi:hypothetical protein